MQEVPDSAPVHEAPTEDVVDNDDDLMKDAKKVHKPFASAHHCADFAIVSCSESVTCPLHLGLLVQTNCIHHTCSCCLYACSIVSQVSKQLQRPWFSFGLIRQWSDN